MNLPFPPEGYEKRMQLHQEAKVLRVVGLDVLGRKVKLAPNARDAWLAMQKAASKNQIHMLLISGFRSIERQAEILKKKIEKGMALPEILKDNAYPGYSEHHTGRAVDIGSAACPHLTEEFEKTSEFAWLNKHAASFGFTLSYPRENEYGIAFEPWHWYLKEKEAEPVRPANAAKLRG